MGFPVVAWAPQTGPDCVVSVERFIAGDGSPSLNGQFRIPDSIRKH
jgi:hypothetical protein